MKNKMARNKAFTLIEILVVATIIGVLVTVTAVSFASSQKRSRDAKRKTDLETVRQALVLYRQDNGSYGDISGGFTAVVSNLYNDGYLTDNSIDDPKNGNPLYKIDCVAGYGLDTDCNKVVLTAYLENDPYYLYELVTP